MNKLVMRRFTFVACLTVSVGLLSFLTVSHLRSQISIYPKQPFTAEFSEKAFNFSTGQSQETRHIIAVRSDGSTVRARPSPSPDNDFLVRTLKLVPDRKEVLVSDPIRAQSTQFASEEAILHSLKHPVDPTCTTHPELLGEPPRVIGTDGFLGFQVVKLESLKDRPDDLRLRIQSWEAPDFGCYPLKVTTLWEKKEDGSVQARTETAATSVIPGEPSPDLFAIPSDYVEMSPSALNQRMEAQYFKRQPTPSEAMLRADRVYNSAKQFAPR